MRSNRGREAEYRRSHWNHSFSAFPLTRLGVCYCLGSGPVFGRSAVGPRDDEKQGETAGDVARCELLLAKGNHQKPLRRRDSRYELLTRLSRVQAPGPWHDGSSEHGCVSCLGGFVGGQRVELVVDLDFKAWESCVVLE
jgi:hypothetical protein